MKVNKFEHENDWENWIGRNVIKHSRKPFKSGEQIGQPVAMATNPHSFKKAFLMDDDSIVDCHQVTLLVT